MAWYKTGTVSVTNNSATVTGSGTNFVSGAQVGFGFQGPNGLVYEITAINSSTSLTITPVYGGSTASGQSYAIVPTQGLTAALASDVTDLITDYQTVADNAGAGKFGDGSAASPGIRFVNDQDTGFFKDTANEIAVSVGGNKVGEFTSTGIDGTVIGGTTPAAITATTLTSTVNGASVARFNRLTDDGDIARFQKDGTTVGSIGVASGEFYHGSAVGGDAFLRSGYSTIVPATSAGANRDNAINLGSSVSRWKNLYLSGGVYLGGTGSANKLDDYEEGTWTPTLSGATTTTYIANTGQYVKVGSVVHIQGEVEINSVGDGDANTVLGLPFVNNGKTSGLAVGFLRDVATNYYSVALRIDANANRIEFEMQTGLDGSNSANSFFTNGTRVMFSGTYYTTA